LYDFFQNQQSQSELKLSNKINTKHKLKAKWKKVLLIDCNGNGQHNFNNFNMKLVFINSVSDIIQFLISDILPFIILRSDG